VTRATTDCWASRTVFVTGANGFLGAHLAEELARRGARVVGLLRDRPAESYFQWAGLQERICVVEGDVADVALLERALNEYEVDTVAVVAGERPVIRSDGTPERDYLYIADAAAAYLTLAEALARDDVPGEAFNFGTGHPISVLTLVRTILETCGRADLKPEVLGTAGPGEIDRQYLSSEKAKRELGWEAQTALAEGLQRTCEWYRQYLQAG